VLYGGCASNQALLFEQPTQYLGREIRKRFMYICYNPGNFGSFKKGILSVFMNKTNILEAVYIKLSSILRFVVIQCGENRIIEFFFAKSESLLKKPLFNCKMCGHCILHFTGMVCTMGCPKEIRNGPCGGVRYDGSCEISPDMKCVWVNAWENSSHMKVFSESIHQIQPPLDRRLKDSSAWINELRQK